MPERSSLSERLERELEAAGLYLAVEDSGDAIVVSGLVDSVEEREAARDIAAAAVGGTRGVDVDNVAVSGALPADTVLGGLSETEVAGFDGAEPGLEDAEALDAGDFTDQETSASTAGVQAGSLSNSPSDDPDRSSAGDVVHVPPTDPVGDASGVIGGFQASSMESSRSNGRAMAPSATRRSATPILRELHEDAATTALVVEVAVLRGIVTLTGHVGDMEDVESAEEVAGRVPGVVEVIEELEVEHLG